MEPAILAQTTAELVALVLALVVAVIMAKEWECLGWFSQVA